MRSYLYKDLYDLEEKHWWHLAKRRAVLYFINRFNKIKNPRILDIGCGTGKNIEAFNNIGLGYGIDKSRQAIKFCKKRGLKNVKLGKSEKTNLKSSYFDVITLLDVLEHVEESPTLKEIHRILKPKGTVILSVPAFDWLWSQWDVVLQHKRRYTIDSLSKVLGIHNFKVIKISYAYSFLVLPAIIVRSIKSKMFKNNYPSDFKLSSSPINWFLFSLSKIESFFMYNNKVPFGTSIFCVATKK